MPGGDRPPAGVVYPGSTAEVQAIVRAANNHHVPLYPISTGNNIGLGSRSASAAGQVVVDLGRRMGRILDIDDKLAFAVVEPGVSYQVLYDELVRRGNRLMLDVTSGPPQGGMIGNALDKGAGYTPYFDHFGLSCGIEIVLGNGEILRTGDGALDCKDSSSNWHTSKYSFGPILDGLFAQSNFGIVTRMGIWLLPRPPAVQSVPFHLPRRRRSRKDHRTVPSAEAVELRADAVPRLQRSLSVRLGRREPGIQGIATASSRSRTRGAGSLREKPRPWGLERLGRVLRTERGGDRAADPARARSCSCKAGKARYIAHEDASAIPPLQVAINAFSGIPSLGELGLLQWRPGGGNTWFLPGTPMDGKSPTNSSDCAARPMRNTASTTW